MNKIERAQKIITLQGDRKKLLNLRAYFKYIWFFRYTTKYGQYKWCGFLIKRCLYRWLQYESGIEGQNGFYYNKMKELDKKYFSQLTLTKRPGYNKPIDFDKPLENIADNAFEEYAEFTIKWRIISAFDCVLWKINKDIKKLLNNETP